MDIKRTVSISYHDVIHVNLEGFLDLLSCAAVGHECLMDVNYELIGCDDDDLIFEVSGELEFDPDELHVGDEVFWHDPDRGLCSCMGTVIQTNVGGDPNVLEIERDGLCNLHVYKHELS